MAKINVRIKGKAGEREVANLLNGIVSARRLVHDLPAHDTRDLPFQRNQNQSAVGGDDLTNPMGLSVEVKREERLAIKLWWKQCCASAARTGGVPILIYRQNGKRWRIVMWGYIPQPFNAWAAIPTVCDTTLVDFEAWFAVYYDSWLRMNQVIPEVADK